VSESALSRWLDAMEKGKGASSWSSTGAAEKPGDPKGNGDEESKTVGQPAARQRDFRARREHCRKQTGKNDQELNQEEDWDNLV